MRNAFTQLVEKLSRNHKKRNKRQRFIRAMSLVVVFCTTYALILPAITMEQKAVCGMEAHTHGEACYAQREVYSHTCSFEEGAQVRHTHEALCYDPAGTLICTLPELVHEHGKDCYRQELICQNTHLHSEACQTETVLICEAEETEGHVHGETCQPETRQELICQQAEAAAHTHEEGCFEAQQIQLCTLEEVQGHAHDAACIVEGWDLTADVESAQYWEQTLAQVTLTGDWDADVLAVAESQLGYRESVKNVILENEALMGYSRYGQWYGYPHGDWCAMYASFCLHYAGVENFPLECSVIRWIEALEEKNLYEQAEAYTAKPGDLIFFDYDQRKGEPGTMPVVADHVGFVVEQIPATDTEPARIRTIEGNTADQVAYVTYNLDDPAIIGYGKLPENPLSREERLAITEVSAMLAELPQAETAVENLRKLNEAGEKAAYDALRQEVVFRVEAAEAAYKELNELQQSRITGLERLEALKEVCSSENWRQFVPLTNDGAVLIQLAADGAQIVRAPEEAVQLPENTVRNLDTIRYPFTARAESYYTDLSYGEAVVKVELVLPLTEDKAVFDLEAMPWLEDSSLTTESRLINETEILCQVLTGSKKLAASETNGIVAPGSFTETAAVKVLDMAHGEQIALIISAAMEHNTWDGICEVHQTEEKLTVITNSFTAHAPQENEDQQNNFDAFRKEADEILAKEYSDSEQYFAALELMQKVADCYNTGGLSDAQFDELSGIITQLSDVNLYAIAEPCIGTNYLKLGAAEEVIYGEEATSLASYAQVYSVKTTEALNADVYSAVFPSSQQIRNEGGANTSSEGAVYVSKTIEGTDMENVFDITLDVVTRDEVNEVYKDPDMAVVVVMDISNTMRSNFGSTTRYAAAMAAGENFLKKFAQQNSTLSRVGYVAFNTSAHQIFGLSACNTTAQATSLTNTMKTATGKIINADGYASAGTRFTNMQAGLKMASNMLANANNQHKYIIFISDGFPTTYIKSGTTGYEPSSSSGTTGNNGVFYDETLNKWCKYGTSYSDTAAIKARELAVTLKGQGVNIFSIGVDVGGQTLWSYHNQSVNASDFSVVERRKEAAYYRTNGYEIGTMHGEIDKTSVTDAEKTAMAQDFKDWLKGSKTAGIGSGYYYDSTNQSGLNAAYDAIFAKILELNASSSHLDWVATDPMPDMGVHEVEAMEFIGFWDKEGNLVERLVGESKDGEQYENTADFHTDTSTIHWDLKNSGYISQAANNTTNYHCTLSYRVRLKNEESVFVERESYDTNDVTTLTYRIIEVEGSQTSISERRTVSFPIPAVEGYLSELNFRKTQPTGNPLEGAEFTLSHDTANCTYCRGDGQSHVSVPDQISVSDRYGMVSFSRIPSGHAYTLTETLVPDGFIATKNAYRVTVSYDALTVTVTDADGNPLEWNATIENDMYYALPDTGHMGVTPFTFGGLLLITGGLVYICIIGRKRQKGGR